jgi:hypothetical protein
LYIETGGTLDIKGLINGTGTILPLPELYEDMV